MKWRGSYTVEAAVIIPVLIWTMAAAMCTGIDLLNEVRGEHEEKQMEDMWAVDSFYQYQILKEGEKMINREIIYERNLTGSFMKIAAGIHAGLDEKLMLRRKLPGLLAVEKAYMDGEGQYWYNISGKQSLDMYCRVKEVDISFIEKLIMSICSEMEILEWNLIQTNCLMLDPELIFITNSNQEIIFYRISGWEWNH